MRAYIRRIGYIAVRLCILAIHIYSIYGDIVYISYTRFLYDGSRLAAVVAKLCILIYTLSVLLSYYSVYIMAIIEHSGLCDSRKRESAAEEVWSERKKRGEQQWGLQVVMKCRNCRKPYKHWACGLYAKL